MTYPQIAFTAFRPTAKLAAREGCAAETHARIVPLVAFSSGRPNYTIFGLNKPIMAADATGQRFKIYVKEAFPPVYLIEFMR